MQAFHIQNKRLCGERYAPNRMSQADDQLGLEVLMITFTSHFLKLLKVTASASHVSLNGGEVEERKTSDDGTSIVRETVTHIKVCGTPFLMWVSILGTRLRRHGSIVTSQISISAPAERIIQKWSDLSLVIYSLPHYYLVATAKVGETHSPDRWHWPRGLCHPDLGTACWLARPRSNPPRKLNR